LQASFTNSREPEAVYRSTAGISFRGGGVNLMRLDDAQCELLLRFLDGQLQGEEHTAVEALLRSSEDARTFLREIAEHAVMVADMERMSYDAKPSSGKRFSEQKLSKRDSRLPLYWLLAVSALVISGLIIGIRNQWFRGDRFPSPVIDRVAISDGRSTIARITGLSGPLTWRGDGGEVRTQLNPGVELSGGTIEGLTPDSWFELTFPDDSKVTIAGVSMLTFSDHGQKKLYLNHGTLTATVEKQPDDRPMVVTTKTAELQILGTRFEVDAELDTTLLQVREGKVQVRRLSDGQTLHVPARHRVWTRVDGDMRAEPSPSSVNDWKSQLHLGPECTYGKWQPATQGRPAALQAIPFLAPQDKSILLHLVGLPVRRPDMAPVTVMPQSHFVLRGRLRTPATVYFGIRVVRTNGEFAGMFLTARPVQVSVDSPDFEVHYELRDFGLDPCVWDRKEELPARPDGLTMTCVWCFTHTGAPTGLEVTDVALVPPTE
ncbi:MAG: FecR domain-containing protein, partial [Planctomycetota bacterium]